MNQMKLPVLNQQTPQPPAVSNTEIRKIVVCLTVTCALAALILGLVFRFTEPLKLANEKIYEQKMVRQLLELGEGQSVIEVRRYLSEAKPLSMAYLLPDGLHVFDMQGKELQKIARTESPDDDWVLEHFPNSHYVGRFFVAKDAHDNVLGYVTEASQQGFKNAIRFFVALTQDFQIRGVEVVEHEEDPGLGAEITKPLFKNQFVGRSSEQVASLTVSKDPMPATAKDMALPREQPIYAVTGATISSRALTEGVKKAVFQLHERLRIVLPQAQEVK